MLSYYETSRHPDDTWRVRGYRLAIASLKKTTEQITTFEQAKALPSVGDRLASHIVEIVQTGNLERTDHLSPEYEIVRQFMKIYGVGPTKAAEFVQKGFRSLQDILDKGNPSTNQRIGIELYDDLNTRIPRAEVEEHKKLVKRVAAKIDPAVQCYVMGSYRRGADTCGDIDFMITKADSAQHHIVEVWQKILVVLRDELRFLTHGLLVSDSVNGMKWQGICKLPDLPHRRIDFLMVPWKQRGAALLCMSLIDLADRRLHRE